MDRRPPTLLKQFTLLQNVPFSKAPSYLHVVPGPTKHTLALVSTAPLSVHMLEPLNFFDSRSDGLTLLGSVHDYMTDAESRIKQFVRTPDGTGLAVVRETGGDAWIMRDHGTSLQRAGRWTTADNVVVLNGGKFYMTQGDCRNYTPFQGGLLRLSRMPPAFSHYIPRQSSPYLSLLCPPCFRFLPGTVHPMNAYMPSLLICRPQYVTFTLRVEGYLRYLWSLRPYCRYRHR